MTARVLIVNLLLAVALAARVEAQPAPGQPRFRAVGSLKYRPIAECSGIVASRRHPGVFWVHNDGGNPAALYAVQRDGSLVGEFAVAAANEDWEDIAIDDEGRLYIGDIGNNGGRRKQLIVYRVDEPDPAGPDKPVRLKVTRRWTLTFPAAPFDCEALFIHAGNGYVISKLYLGAQAGVYRFPLDEAKEPIVLEKVGTVPVRTPVTAADISPDGKRLAVLSVAGLNVFDIDGELKDLQAAALFIPYVHATMEACCFADEGVLVATEPREMILFDVSEAPSLPPGATKGH